MTVLEAIQRSAEFLTRKGVEAARLQAELLLAEVLGCERMRLYLNFEQQISAAQTAQLRQLVLRRAQREPLQQIIGHTSFCGFRIEVNRAVLVPRPETEILAEMGWNWLTKFMQERGTEEATQPAPHALDFGTGSGCIAIALARNCAAARVTALDDSAAALAVARRNIEANGVANQVTLRESNGLDILGLDYRFELLISNPPYIPSADIPSLEPEVRDYEPVTALDGGPDGLSFYRMLAQQAIPLMAPGAKMMLEIGDGQAPAVSRLLQDQNWIVEALPTDYTGRIRIVVARRG